MPESLSEILSNELIRVPRDRAANVLIIAHRQADPDAICSAAALSDLLVLTNPCVKIESRILIPQGASTLGQILCSQLGIEFYTEKNMKRLGEPDLIIIVDTGDLQLLSPFADELTSISSRKILIDHHSTNSADWGVDRAIVEPASTSTCEIITRGFQESRFTRKIAQTLLVGLMFDSQHLGIATVATLEAALILLKNGAEIDEARNTLRRKLERSEILARLKSAQRLRFEEVGKYLVAKSEVSSFHASVARMLLDIGVDVGIAYGKSDGEARISVRSTQRFHKETAVDFALMIKRICEVNGLIGGGHSTAASASGGSDPLPVVEGLIEELKRLLHS